MSVPPDPMESLLAERAWVRGLARTLVRDDASADDLEQEAWLAALQRPPATAASPRGWIATVMRRAAGRERRGAFRRDRRERSAARPEALPPAGDLASHAEQIERVVRAALALEEPLRATVLLRFFEGLPPSAIAARTGVPLETVRTRLRRGLARLRTALDASSDGDRRRWIAAILPLAYPGEAPGVPGAGPRAATRAGRVLLVSATARAAAVAAVILLATFAFLLRGGGQESAPPPPETGDSRGAARVAPAALPPGDAPADAAPPSADPGPAAPPAPPPGAAVALRIVSPEGVPLSPEEVRAEFGPGSRAWLVRSALVDSPDWRERFLTGTGMEDAWRVPVDLVVGDDGARLDARVPAGEWRLVLAGPKRPPAMAEAFAAADGGVATAEIRLRAVGVTRRIRVLADDTRAVLAGAVATPWFEHGDDQAFVPGVPLVAGDDGVLELFATAPGDPTRSPSWWIEAPGRAGLLPVSLSPSAAAEEIEDLPLPRTTRIEGLVRGPDGSPVAGAKAWTGRKGRTVAAESDAGGRFVLDGVGSSVGRPGASIAGQRAEVFVMAPGPRAVAISARVGLDPGNTVEVVLGPAPGEEGPGAATLRGRITRGGLAAAGLVVLPQPAAKEATKVQRFAFTDADGRYSVAGLPAGPCSLRVLLDPLIDNYTVVTAVPIELAAGAEREVDLDLPDGAVRVRVSDATDDTPVAGVYAWCGPAERRTPREVAPGWTGSAGDIGRTGPDGTVLLRGLSPGVACSVGARSPVHDPTATASAMPGTIADPPLVELRLPRIAK